jgi:predicted helicase
MPEYLFKGYLKKLEGALARGDSTEHTHRPALKDLIETFAKDVVATNEPKRSEVGAPDYIVTKGQVPLGYIETKDIGNPLDEEERSEQLIRYRQGLSNLILTDYLEYRWYFKGEHRLTARLARIGAKGKLTAEKDGGEKFAVLIGEFLAAKAPAVTNSKDLAERMAALARIIKGITGKALSGEATTGSLHEQMDGFRKVLIHDLSEEQFADMYTQTICYGLFAARCNFRRNERFTREHAAYDLPKTNPFLRKMFNHIAGPELDERIAWAVDDLAELLHRADIGAILKDFGKHTRREDPVVHFYETFLAAYDPELREKRGVYYTPEPVVSYIVRSVDYILKTRFDLSDGLANASKIKIKVRGSKEEEEIHKVLILDPATGTGTFLYGIVDQIYERFKGNRGMWSGYVSQHLLPRLFGLELMMAPYAVAHLKLGLQLVQTGYDFRSGERLRVYLTNSLEEAKEIRDLPLFAQWLAEEASAAGKVKHEVPVMVVLGNPPYAGHSANKGEWIRNLLRGNDTLTNRETYNYFKVDGKFLGERNPKWINDDYAKFIRFAQWRIEQTGYGVLAFITNHGYLDNPTYRGMRQCLMDMFDEIYVLDLHGNADKKERCPDGSDDKNVFDVKRGVAIGIFVKHRPDKKEYAAIRHADLWGLREIYSDDDKGGRVLTGGKYHFLWNNNIETTGWTTLKPQSPDYLFVPQDHAFKAEYEVGWNLTDIMPINGVGMTTARDHVVIDFEKDPILERVRFFRNSNESDEVVCERLEIPLKKGWNTSEARKAIQTETNLEQYIKPVLYRPFDNRLIFYHDSLVWRTVKQIMFHMLAGENMGLVTTRQTRDTWGALATRNIMTHKSLAAYDINSLFPLYLYPVVAKEGLFGNCKPTSPGNGRRANLAPEFIEALSNQVKMRFVPDGRGNRKSTYGPEDVFSYMYAVFHSPEYRSRYEGFLKRGFPRLPIVSDADLFRGLCDIGDELVGLHLMGKPGPRMVNYPVPGDNRVNAIRYVAPEGTTRGRVWINRTQFFEGVPPEVWDLRVGGYQVCQKWLKDLKGRPLSFDDQVHYQNIVSALSETIRLTGAIDELIDEHGGWPIE